VVLDDPRVGQPSISINYLAPSYNSAEDGEAYALEVLNEVMGGGTTARLYRTLVVEQGVASAAGSFYSADALNPMSFGFYVSPRPGIEPDAAEAALRAEIDRLLEQGVTEDEVSSAKRRLKAGVVYAQDDLGTAPRLFGSALTTGQTVADVEAWPQRIGRVTADQVNMAARAVLQERRSVTAVLLPKPVS
jgi:zinc protease